MSSPVWPWRALPSLNSSPPMCPVIPELFPGSRVPVRTTGSLGCALTGSFAGVAQAQTAPQETTRDNNDRVRIFLSSVMVWTFASERYHRRPVATRQATSIVFSI